MKISPRVVPKRPRPISQFASRGRLYEPVTKTRPMWRSTVAMTMFATQKWMPRTMSPNGATFMM